MKSEYLIQQINVSDDDYELSQFYKNSSDKIKKGELIFSYESSKADFDVESESEGYIYFNNNYKIGDMLKVGSLVGVITDRLLADDDIQNLFKKEQKLSLNTQLDKDQVFTKKAEKLINQNSIDRKLFSKHKIVTESIVKSLLKKASFFDDPKQDISYYYSENENKDFNINFEKSKLKRLAIIGAGKAALQLLDAVITEKKYYPVCYYDNNENLKGKLLMNVPVLGKINVSKIKKDYNEDNFDEIIISFSGNIKQRESVFNELMDSNIPIANVIHSSAIISNFVKIGVGNIIFSNVRIGPFVEIKNNNVISAFCSFEHHSLLQSNNTFGPAVITSGSCTIMNNNKFGTGVFVEPKIKIGDNCLLSSGIVIRQNVPDNSTVRNLNKVEIKTK
jgi:sugar O-acyltransferase (sialic acid O-acetyltransferase NeuD family)